MEMDANKIVDVMTGRFSQKMALLEKENAFLMVRLSALEEENEQLKEQISRLKNQEEASHDDSQ